MKILTLTMMLLCSSLHAQMLAEREVRIFDLYDFSTASKLELGKGYMSTLNYPVGDNSCVKGKEFTKPLNHSHSYTDLTFERQIITKEIAASLGLEFLDIFKWMPLPLSFETRRIQETQSLTYLLDISRKVSKSWYDGSPEDNSRCKTVAGKRTCECGDSYISSVTYGHAAKIEVKFNFSSASKAHKFGAEIPVLSKILSVEGRSHTQNVTSFSSAQIILHTVGGGRTINCGGGYSLTTLDSVAKAIEDCSTEVQQKFSGTEPALISWSYKYFNYPGSDKRNLLKDLLIQGQGQVEYAQMLPQDSVSKVSLFTRIETNLNKIDQALKLCLKSQYKHCELPTLSSDILNFETACNEFDITTKNVGWCDDGFLGQDNLCRALDKTVTPRIRQRALHPTSRILTGLFDVAAMRKFKLPITYPIMKNDEKRPFLCSKIKEGIIKKINSLDSGMSWYNLDLSNRHIEHIGLLATLPVPKILTLASNEISSFDPLGDLKGLEWVDLAGNPANDFDWLKRLQSLQQVRISLRTEMDTTWEISKKSANDYVDFDGKRNALRLSYAILHKDLGMLKLLLHFKADPNKDGIWVEAVKNNWIEGVDLMLSNGAYVDKQRALEIAKTNQYLELFELIRNSN